MDSEFQIWKYYYLIDIKPLAHVENIKVTRPGIPSYKSPPIIINSSYLSNP